MMRTLALALGSAAVCSAVPAISTVEVRPGPAAVFAPPCSPSSPPAAEIRRGLTLPPPAPLPPLTPAFPPAPPPQMETMASLKTPAGWSSLGPAPRSQMLELTFAVKQTNTDKLEAALMNAADPDSANYGAWLSNEAVHRLVAPAAASAAAVRAFLTANGVLDFADASPNGDFITAAVTVAQAEALLSTTYEAFQVCKK